VLWVTCGANEIGLCALDPEACETFDVRAEHQKPLALSLEFSEWI